MNSLRSVMHHVLIMLTLTFIQGHIHLIIMIIIKSVFGYSNHFSSNAHQVCCEVSPTTGVHKLCQSDELDLYSRSQLRLKLDTLFYLLFKSNMSDNIEGLSHGACSKLA